MSERLAVLRAFPAEGWPSMDLVADQLIPRLGVADPCPPFRRLASRLGRRGFNFDRLLNRQLLYPLHLVRVRRRFDLFHVADHSYAHLVHHLPAGRAGVYCHDLDAFRCLLDPAAEPRPWWFRVMAGRILSGLRKAAVVFHSTRQVSDSIIRYGLVPAGRLVHAPYGVAAEFTPGAPPPQWLPAGSPPWLLHVGSCIPRKRVDVLLDVLTAVRRRRPGTVLVKVGGEWSPAHRDRIVQLGLSGAIIHRTGLSRAELAGTYRAAGAVLLPSEAEGFGLPIIEALACGAAVVASDLPVLREVGGAAVTYAPVADVPAWTEAVDRMLAGDAPPPAARQERAAGFTWAEHARVIADAYHRLGCGG